ncbi:hypothetical protein [Streptomyces sp. NPDC093071]|uniref:hypothetical protein n=1 Tax=Streptomyces sp. NPDC093071 TaxID=3366022 RepID=UPI0037F686B8
MRQSLDLFEAAGQGHVALATTARRYMELMEQEAQDKPSGHISADAPAIYPLQSSGGGGTHRISEFSWPRVVALAQAAPPEARLLYGLIGATAYHLGGQEAPSPAFLCQAFATALRSMGLEGRVIPSMLRVIRGDDEPLPLPEWRLPPTVTANGEILGHMVVWCEDAGRLVDPSLLLGQSRFGPGAAEHEIFRAPAVLPAPGLNALLGFRPATHREGYLLAYEFHLDWEEHLGGVLTRLDEAAIARFARVLATSATLAAATDPHA